MPFPPRPYLWYVQNLASPKIVIVQTTEVTPMIVLNPVAPKKKTKTQGTDAAAMIITSGMLSSKNARVQLQRTGFPAIQTAKLQGTRMSPPKNKKSINSCEAREYF